MSYSKIDMGKFVLPSRGKYVGPLQKFIEKMEAKKKMRAKYKTIKHKSD